MITQIEFKEIIQHYVKKTKILNLNTLDNYIAKKTDYNLYVNNSNINKVKGDMFEWICKYYLMERSDEVYLFRDIPIYLRDELNIGFVDKGIDIIFKFSDVWYGVQCKWRTLLNFSIHKDLISGFKTEFDKTKLHVPMIMTNVENITKYHIHSGIKWATRKILQKNIDADFFNYILNDEHQKIIPETKIYTLRPYQQDAINSLKNSTATRKQCIMACGTGKSMIMMKYAEEFDKVFIMLPSLQLVSQFYKKMKDNDKNKKILCICSDLDVEEFTCGEADEKIGLNLMNEFIAHDIVQYTTDKKIISKTIKDNNKIIVLCTYQSGKLLKGEKFNLGMFDEAHKTVNNQIFSFALDDKNVKIDQRLFMTATVKYCKNNIVVSMDNKKIYGDIIYEYSFKKAIEDKHILDFQIVTYVVPDKMEDIVNERYIMKDDLRVKSEILISALLLAEHIKTDKKCTKILTYHNSIKKVHEFKKVLKYVFDKFNIHANIYSLDGSTKMNIRETIFDEFKESIISVICSARVLNEGVDIPCVNTVMFVDSRSSMIDVTQCIGRGMRLYKDQEKCSIIVPINYNQVAEKSNYSELVKLLSTMVYIDDKLIENFILKNVNNKITIRNMGMIVGIVNNNEIKYNADELYENLKVVVWDSQHLIFEYKRKLLFDFCDKEGRVPQVREKDKDNNNWSIGTFFHEQKKQMDGYNSNAYKRLSGNEIAKNDLDRYIEYCILKGDKTRTPLEESKKLLFNWCNTHKTTPTDKIKDGNNKIGEWLHSQKQKINSKDDELYISLSENLYVKIALDKYLEKKSLGHTSLTQDEWKTLVFEYCNKNKCIPKGGVMDITNYHDIGQWLWKQRSKIINTNDILYKLLSENIYVKEYLDEYIANIDTYKNKVKPKWGDKCEALFEFCNINKRIPHQKESCNDVHVGSWMMIQRSKIKNRQDKKYIKLIKNEYIKTYLDKYIKE